MEVPSIVTDEPVTVNVGGVQFVTSVATLKFDEGSLLAEGSLIDAVSNGIVPFIDRDPDIFRHILTFLRSKGLVLPPTSHDDGQTWKRLGEEARFFRLALLQSALAKNANRSAEAGQVRGNLSTCVYICFERTLLFSEENIVGGYFCINGKMSNLDRGGWFHGFNLQHLQDSFRVEVAKTLDSHRQLGYAMKSSTSSQASLPLREIDQSEEKTVIHCQHIFNLTVLMELEG
uniref:Potassium channel tetramerisation-type BTB domain-containing protein n=1 Tax=Compsopogon caeruleus TaxID=31354 RepID=A0A7S1TJ89_9RHOD|mmetsp:Transcript_8889/g.17925  ORF Transcript_8889/g.17925 Transcript_8889/m.17925 type:complete len:231 (+) Transcript_8889:2-694(+)